MASSLIIFVVDDELLIQDLLDVALVEGGFEVAKASSGEEAIAMFEAADVEYRALITDVNLAPGKLTGWDVARRGRELHPELPVVYMTGDSGHHWASEGVPNSVLVPKPFAPVQIVTAISQLLNAGSNPLPSSP